jgi:hypothetical protein
MAEDAFPGSFDFTSLLRRSVPLRMTAECGYAGVPKLSPGVGKGRGSTIEQGSEMVYLDGLTSVAQAYSI